jgi:hypothetical protein
MLYTYLVEIKWLAWGCVFFGAENIVFSHKFTKDQFKICFRVIFLPFVGMLIYLARILLQKRNNIFCTVLRKICEGFLEKSVIMPIQIIIHVKNLRLLYDILQLLNDILFGLLGNEIGDDAVLKLRFSVKRIALVDQGLYGSHN